MFSKLSIDVINSLTISEIDVLRFVDNNKSRVLNWSIQYLSKETFVSTATIMRLCKKLGFSGFTELKYHLKEEINTSEQFGKPETLTDIINHNMTSLLETSELLDEKMVLEVVKLMMKPMRIHFFGKGLTYTVLTYAAKQLLTCNRSNSIYQDTHIAYLVAESMDENDLLFLASLSGNTHQVVRMAQIAKSRKATVVTLSANNNNELSKIGDYNFGIYNIKEKIKPYDISSRLPILFILNIIITIYVINKNQL
ncbi:MAG: MurR/RpiR family transcriptional regulator [Bacilli bacterium]|nr:MurR/RpiR family transcriptional regulator [Bacilli bacterium]